MRGAKLSSFMALLAAALVMCVQTSWAVGVPEGGMVLSPTGPDFYLTFTPSMPSPGQKVTVSLASSGAGLPAGTGIRWNLSGAPFSDANVNNANGAEYFFTPNGPGSYAIRAELFDSQGGYFGSSSLEIVIGGGFVTREFGGPPTNASEMFLGVVPAQPRTGQPVSFTMHFGRGIPQGGTVRWDVSGGQTANMEVTGVNKEVCSFVPGSQGQYFVRAMLQDARGNLLGEVSLGFIPIP